ncbi:permease [Clostridium vincentii]|uniref:Putative permease n=1 Tax=Clostridium vincentii TaxID=52704 RepID=A0A2T0B975_9CLOT|nr:permease [Clostridium vincentii]PRR80451.1 putative permease [Clostridium vincentii]
MKNLIKRYKFFIVTIVIVGIITIFNKELGLKSLGIAGFSLKEMALVIPPVFILLGLLDIWVPKETMIKFMGEGSGIKGVILSIIIGSAAAGPLYGAFPVAAVFMKKGVKFTNILIFIGAWSTTKIPMLLFEISALGKTFALTRLAIDIPGIIIIAYILAAFTSKDEIKKIYKNAEKL